jgi:hypothetical protein
MYPTYILQELWQGEWHEIGWRASTPKSRDALEEHGQKLADSGSLVRLALLSLFRDGEPTVVRTYVAAVA